MTTLSGFKALPDGRWVGFFSNIFYDRDVMPDAPKGERFTYGALKEASEWMNSGNMPDLEVFHLDNVKVGKATDTYMAGPFIVAEGVWNDDELGQKARAFFENSQENWRMSHGFGYFAKDRIAGEYTKFRPREVTVLPGEWAANPLTLFKEADMGGLRKDIEQMLVDVFHLKPDEAKAKVDEGMKMADKALLDGELPGKKDGEAPAAVTEPAGEPTIGEGGAAAEPPKEEEPKEDVVSDDNMALALVDALSELTEERALRTALAEDVKALKEAVAALQTGQKAVGDGLEARVKALETADAERVEALPKAVRAALSKRASGESAVEDKDVKADVENREAGLKGDPSFKNDPIGAMMRHAGVG